MFEFYVKETERIAKTVNSYAAKQYINGLREFLSLCEYDALYYIYREQYAKDVNEDKVLTALPDGFYSIPSPNVYGLNKKVEKLNRRAVKLGLPEVGIEECFNYTYKYSDSFTDMPIYQKYTVFKAVTTHKISMGNWSLIARIDREEGGAIISQVPHNVTHYSRAAIKRARAMPGLCDHCNKLRSRRKTFIVRDNSTNSYKQVGASCLKDFIGEDSAGKILSFNTMIKQVCTNVENYPSGAYGAAYIKVADVVNLAHIVSSFYGYVSKAKSESYGGVTTAQRVSEYLFTTRKDPKLEKALLEGITLDFNTNNAIKWAASISDAEVELNEYLGNLRTIARSGIVSARQFGYTVSIPGAYARHLENERRKNKVVPEDPIAEVGTKLSLTMKPTPTDKKKGITLLPAIPVTIVNVRYNDDWGNYNIRFEDTAGRTGYASSKYNTDQDGEELVQGETYTFAGRVKKVGPQRDGGKYTSFNYCSFKPENQTYTDLGQWEALTGPGG